MEWIKHDGKGCPVDSKCRVKVKFRDGYVGVWLAESLNESDEEPSYWEFQNSENDIVEYMVFDDIRDKNNCPK